MFGEGPVKPGDARSVKLTYEDFLLFPDDGKRHELIDGEHYVTPSPNTAHQVIVGNLHWIIRNYSSQHPVGRVFLAPFDVVFSNFDIVEPDLLYIAEERLKVLTTKNVRGAPDLVIEVLSKGTRKTDEVTKRRLYERFHVREYWSVDPEIETVKIYRRTESGFDRVGEYFKENGDAFSPPLLSGLSVSLEAVFDQV